MRELIYTYLIYFQKDSTQKEYGYFSKTNKALKKLKEIQLLHFKNKKYIKIRTLCIT